MPVLKRSVLFLLACVLFITQAFFQLVVFNAQTAEAREFKTSGIARSHEAIVAFIEICAGGRLKTTHESTTVRLAGSISTDRASKGQIFHIYDPSVGVTDYTGEHKVFMSHLWNNEKLECQDSQLSKRAIETLYGDMNTFMEKFYTLSGDTWTRKSEWGSADNYGALVSELRAEARRDGFYVTKNGGQYPTDALDLRWTVLRPLFESCFQAKSSQTDPNYLVESPSGKEFEVKPGMYDSNTIRLGSFFGTSLSGTSAFGQGTDGKITCGTFAWQIRQNPNYYRQIFLSAAELREQDQEELNEQEREAKLTEIAEKLRAIPEAALTECYLPNLSDTARAYMEQEGLSIVEVWRSDVGAGTQPGGWVTKFADGEPDARWELILGCFKEKDPAAAALVDEIYGIMERDPPTAEERELGEAAGDEEPVDNDCDFGTVFTVNILENALNWFGCAVIKGMISIVEGMTGAIGSLLTTDTDQGTREALQGVWNRFLNIANILFVIAFLIMVSSTALNLGIFDAYTVKKLLPRIIAAAILANISFSICYLLVEATNMLGGAVDSIITDFIPANAGNAGGGAAIATGAAIGAAALALVGGLAVGGIFAVIPGILYIIFGILVAYTIILVRRTLIILLIVLAPVAIVLWVIPGTENLAKRWWKTFIQMLMVYPIIIAFIATGQFMSALIIQASGNNGASQAGFFESVSALIVLILPLIMLPTVFKMASSTLANVTGMLNDKSRGLIDRSKKLRGQKMAENWENLKAGNRFKGGKSDTDGTPLNFRGRLNRGMQSASLINKAGLRPSEMRGNLRSARGAVNLRAAKELMEKNETFKNMASDDDKLWALMMGGGDINKVKEILQKRAPSRFNAETDPNTLNAAAAEVMRVHKEGGGQAALIAATIAQAGTGTGYNYGNKGGYNDDMYDAIARASGMDKNLAGMMLGEMRPALKNSGRMEFAGGYARTATILGRRMDALATDNDMIEVDGQMVHYDREQAMRDTMRDAYMSNGGAFIAGKKRTIEMASPMMTEDIRAAAAAGPESFIREVANVAGKYDAAAAVAPQNAEALNTGVLQQELDLNAMSPEVREKLRGITHKQVKDDDGNITEVLRERKDVNGNVRDASKITVQEAMEHLRDDQSFQGTRREHGRSIADQARMQQQQMNTIGGVETPGFMGPT